MTVHKLRGTLQDYLDHMTGKKIVGCGVEDEEFVIVLDDGSEVFLFSSEDLAIAIEFPEQELH